MAISNTVSFTSNLSSAIYFDGVVKIKADDLQEGSFVRLLEERVDGTYEIAVNNEGNPLQVAYPQRSALFDLKGNYKINRSSEAIPVGYED